MNPIPKNTQEMPILMLEDAALTLRDIFDSLSRDSSHAHDIVFARVKQARRKMIAKWGEAR